MSSHIAPQLAEIIGKIESAAEKSGRKRGDVRLIAVSKTFPVSDILEAWNAGQRLFGENKVQELENKVPALPSDIDWHLIGHLQSNKSAKAVNLASWIHSVDSAKLLRHLQRHAEAAQKKIKILLELNVSGEESKEGLSEEKDINEAVETLLASQWLDFRGLMTMAPLAAGESERRAVFSKLREKRDALSQTYKIALPELSMGMSNDFAEAIAEGATFVRIGTAIFGKRDYSN